MSVSKSFKEAIKAYFDKRAAEDELFAVTYKKENKSLEECCNYIMKCAQKNGAGGYTDAEVFGWAVHYYDEDDIKDIKPVQGAKVVINKAVDLSEEEKELAKEKAMQQLIEDEKKKLKLTQKVKLSAEDMAEVKKRAMEKAVEETKQKLISKKSQKPPKTSTRNTNDEYVESQPDLFS